MALQIPSAAKEKKEPILAFEEKNVEVKNDNLLQELFIISFWSQETLEVRGKVIF